jgi:hypothetical protein
MLTKSWKEIIAAYQGHPGDWRSIHAPSGLARRIDGSPLASGLFAWTSMFDLCIVQTEVSDYPYNGPLVRVAPASSDRLEFAYEDTRDRAKQWRRSVDADDAFLRLLKFLDQLRWFPADVLKSLERE